MVSHSSSLVEVPALPAESIPLLREKGVQHLGVLALEGEAASRLVYDASLQEVAGGQGDAIGFIGHQLHVEGELAGGFDSYVSLTLPKEPGNVLLIPRRQVMAARIALGGAIQMHGGVEPTAALMQSLHRRPLGQNGTVYDAVISYANIAGTGRTEVSIVDGRLRPLHVAFPTK